MAARSWPELSIVAAESGYTSDQRIQATEFHPGGKPVLQLLALAVGLSVA